MVSLILLIFKISFGDFIIFVVFLFGLDEFKESVVGRVLGFIFKFVIGFKYKVYKVVIMWSFSFLVITC